MQILPECLLIYRLHDKQITSTTLERQRTEVLKIQQRYYTELFGEFPSEMQDFYIGGIYFKDTPDVNKFLNYAKWLKKNAVEKFGKKAIDYALFEVLAEYKRRGVKRSGIVKAMLNFPPVFVAKELLRRKEKAKKDIKKCTAVAESNGLKQTAGTKEYPIFEKTVGNTNDNF